MARHGGRFSGVQSGPFDAQSCPTGPGWCRSGCQQSAMRVTSGEPRRYPGEFELAPDSQFGACRCRTIPWKGRASRRNAPRASDRPRPGCAGRVGAWRAPSQPSRACVVAALRPGRASAALRPGCWSRWRVVAVCEHFPWLLVGVGDDAGCGARSLRRRCGPGPVRLLGARVQAPSRMRSGMAGPSFARSGRQVAFVVLQPGPRRRPRCLRRPAVRRRRRSHGRPRPGHGSQDHPAGAPARQPVQRNTSSARITSCARAVAVTLLQRGDLASEDGAAGVLPRRDLDAAARRADPGTRSRCRASPAAN